MGKYQNKYYQKHNEERKIYWAKRRATLRKTIFEMLGGKCAHCGFNDERAFQIDHIHGNGRKSRGELRSSSPYYVKVIKSLNKEEGRYQLLCANCNMIKG